MATEFEVPVSGGYRMRVSTDEPLGRALATTGVWEPQITAAFQTLLAPGDVCVDVGAHIGFFTLLAAELVGPCGRVYAIEPAAETYAALVANVDLNSAANVTPLGVAAGAEAGEVKFENRPYRQSLLSAIGPPTALDAVVVPMRPLASLIPPSDVKRIRLIKIDVEGYELEVLRGLEPLLASGARPAIVVELHAGVVEAALPLLEALCGRYGLKAYKLSRDERLDQAIPWASQLALTQSLERAYERHLLLAPPDVRLRLR